MNPKPITVSQLNRQIRQYLESELGEVTVIGELSNVKYHSSGHIYCSLKDNTAQVRCVFFRNYQTTQIPVLKDGDDVTIKGLLTLYEGRGDYQIIIYSLHTKGVGDLYQQFALLKQKCTEAGYFNPDNKKPLPTYPQTIGIITSATSAALQDCLTTINRRYPLANIIIYPAEVQGENALLQIINAINTANKEKTCNVLLLVRGGGSMEDLFVFNAETLVKAIFASTIPIVSGIGHETDFTLADFVADLRAATPTAAAEKSTPDIQQLATAIKTLHNRLIHASKRLLLHARLNINQTQYALEQTIQNNIVNAQTKFIKLITKLEAISPLATLKRGYAVVKQEQQIITNSKQLNLIIPINIQLAQGIISCKILDITEI